ncbi:hypothetical protein GCM10028803_11770 [Larkinella knui]|uniref:Uncharacterized protein n=1 Tax=Larkinella knui TaxID=2025310 RepID=A0A3P1CCA2_9BACT|nr:hypothetical protein [Larkinella knui]RRB10860.1 hypothetical protein EHT87_27330 [Larkinella knui]
MNAIRIRTELTQNHELLLRNLPLKKGKKVEVIILEDEQEEVPSLENRFPLRGKPLRYDDPFGSATDNSDWEAAQ